jgi:hypothetical protein
LPKIETGERRQNAKPKHGSFGNWEIEEGWGTERENLVPKLEILLPRLGIATVRALGGEDSRIKPNKIARYP